jgi:Bacterial inner membrane protein
MLMTYIGNNLAFALHYGLLHHWTAVAMNGLMGVQTVVAIWLVRWPRLRWAYYALVPALGAASLITWHGLPSVLAATATALSTIGRMQRNDVLMADGPRGPHRQKSARCDSHESSRILPHRPLDP